MVRVVQHSRMALAGRRHSPSSETVGFAQPAERSVRPAKVWPPGPLIGAGPSGSNGSYGRTRTVVLNGSPPSSPNTVSPAARVVQIGASNIWMVDREGAGELGTVTPNR